MAIHHSPVRVFSICMMFVNFKFSTFPKLPPEHTSSWKIEEDVLMEFRWDPGQAGLSGGRKWVSNISGTIREFQKRLLNI